MTLHKFTKPLKPLLHAVASLGVGSGASMPWFLVGHPTAAIVVGIASALAHGFLYQPPKSASSCQGYLKNQ